MSKNKEETKKTMSKNKEETKETMSKNKEEAKETMSNNKEETKVEEFKFQAEMSQLLHLITHSLYSHREIFLRELISNASDALNKLHFMSHTDSKILGDDSELKIEITLDEKKKTLSIKDNGIGMTHDELISHIGTIASSGTSNFISKLTGDKNKDLDLIGQFGVGFYSVFMVADEVTVETCSHTDNKGHRWVSAGTGSYTIESVDTLKRGTCISFKFKKDAKDFSTKWKIENTIKKYSDFVSFPIFLNEEKSNKSTALWVRPPKEIKQEEYNEFYKYIANAQADPLDWIHFSVEAPVQYKALLFIPKEADRALFSQDQLDSRVQLYVQRVFIQNDCKELLPQWLRFIKGVIDTEDLSLNVSRESTQQSPIMEKIHKHLIKKLLSEFKKWANKDKEKYNAFWKEFGNFIKEGIHTDFATRDKLVELYRCSSSKEPDNLISLEDYLNRMPADQEEIYYVSGKNSTVIKQSPNLEYFAKNDIEVLYLYEEIDEFIMPSIDQYKEKKLICVDKAELKIKDEAKEQETQAISEDDKNKLLSFFKATLKERVEDVIESHRLVESPCTLVSPKDSMNPNIERMMKMMDNNFQNSKRVMEVNTKNSLIKNLAGILKENPEDSLLKDCIEQLYESASLLEGSLTDTSRMLPRSTSIMEKATAHYLKSKSE